MTKDRLSYPLSLVHRDAPDFLFRVYDPIQEKDVEIGIEKIESVPQNEAEKEFLREKFGGPEVYYITHHKPVEVRKCSKELKQEIKDNCPGPGWEGDEAATEWADAMLYSVKKKMVIFEKKCFKKFEKNWLLIYDNWSLPPFDSEREAELLLPKIKELSCFDKFDIVFIITGNKICEYSSTGFVQLENNDLWAEN